MFSSVHLMKMSDLLVASERARQMIYRELQGDLTQKILDDRPDEDGFPPISLLFAGFGEFSDALNRREDEIKLGAKRQELELRVDDFADEMRNFTKRRIRGGMWPSVNLTKFCPLAGLTSSPRLLLGPSIRMVTTTGRTK